MIEIYRRDENGKDRLICTFETLDELVRHFFEHQLADFGYTPTDRTYAPTDEYFDPKGVWDISSSRYRYIAYENDRFVTPDRLVGLRRAYVNSFRRWRGWCGRRRNAWGRFRGIRTTQERRENEFLKYDEDAREYGITSRGRRRGHNLPNAWDDYRAHSERSWKFQTKRRHQWKEK